MLNECELSAGEWLGYQTYTIHRSRIEPLNLDLVEQAPQCRRVPNTPSPVALGVITRSISQSFIQVYLNAHQSGRSPPHIFTQQVPDQADVSTARSQRNYLPLS